MEPVNVLFFGSTTDSLLIVKALNQLNTNINILAVITQPPRPIGRKHIITPTPVELWAREYSIPVHHFETQKEKPTHYVNENEVISTLSPYKADLIISASYGQLIPWTTIQSAKFGGINVHPSLLPRWRGADPIPWTIISGDQETGVSIVSLSEQFDEGKLLNQKSIPLTQAHQRESLREELFTIGASLIKETLPLYLNGTLTIKEQEHKIATYARRLTKTDGFLPWELCKQIIQNDSLSPLQLQTLPFLQHILKQMNNSDILTRYTNPHVFMNHFFRALTPWPGIWTIASIQKKQVRMNIRSINTSHENCIETIQLEGKNPTKFTDIQHSFD
jgi:methionyl-tRNA formyltransferase